MDVILAPVIRIIAAVIELYIWVIIINAILSWLVAFNVVNPGNRLVHVIGDVTFRLTDPALRRLRGMLPNLNGIDLSPFVLILGLILIKDVILGLLWKYGVAG